MHFDLKYRDAAVGKGEHNNILKNWRDQPCAVCTSPTAWIDTDLMEPVCGEACQRSLHLRRTFRQLSARQLLLEAIEILRLRAQEVVA
jgi:hypothetical protein